MFVVDAHVLEDLGMDHAAAHDFQPPRLAAYAAARAAADDALDVHLGGGFGERKIGWPEADVQFLVEEGAQEVAEHALEVREADVLVHHEALHLVEHGGVGDIGITAVDAARRDDAQGRLA